MNNITRRLFVLMVPILSAMTLHAQWYYQTDYTCHYTDATDPLTNDALYKDVPGHCYYIAQQPRPYTTDQIMITRADQDFNILSVFKYKSLTSSMYLAVHDIKEAVTLHHLVIIGSYINEGVSQGSFVMSVDKPTGTFLWFKIFPDVNNLAACVTHVNASGSGDNIIAVGQRGGPGHLFGITGTSGYIMSVDASTGAVNWAKDVESSKYIGNSMGITGIFNRLSDIAKIDDNTFAATGLFNQFVIMGGGGNISDHLDGDGALIVFDGTGAIINEQGLGTLLPINSSGTKPFVFQTGEAITYDPIDNTVVIAGNVDHFSTGYFGPICPVPAPYGIWGTKISLASYTTLWSNIYDFSTNGYSANTYYDAWPIHITNDDLGSYGIAYNSAFDPTIATPPYTGNQVVMKIEPTVGGVTYSRAYTSAAYDGVINDVCSGIGTNDIIGIGYLTSTPAKTAWNLEVFDHINSFCQSYDFPVSVPPHYYDMFPLYDQPYTTAPTDILFNQPKPAVTKTDDCPKIFLHYKPAGSGSPVVENEASSNVVIGYDPAGNMVTINAPEGEVYSGAFTNCLGQSIQKFDKINGSFSVSTKGLAAGIYYMELHSDNNKIAKMIPIQ